MQLFFILRGVTHAQEMFCNFMKSQMFPWKQKNLKTGKETLVRVQGALRPVQLYEYVFPKESMDEVFTMLDIKNTKKNFEGLKAATFRKMLGHKVKPIPDYKEQLSHHFVGDVHNGIGIYPIGIKEDPVLESEAWNVRQEML